VDEVVDLLDGVTGDDIQRVASDLIREDYLNLAVVGPFRSQRPFARLIGA